MRPVTQEQFDQLLARVGIRVADAKTGIGRALTYDVYPRRIVVVHFAENEKLEYLVGAISRILELDEEWILLTRYGTPSDLDILPADPNMAAIAFGPADRDRLADYLCTRPTDLASVSADLYILGASGRTLMTWDHHTADEGLDVQLQSVAESSRLLVSLNDFGAELEVFYSEG
jgi:hypothetical protein